MVVSVASKQTNYILGKGSLFFCCMDPTEPNFWQMKMILISHKNFFFFTTYFFYYDFFGLDHNKIHKKQKFSTLDIAE